MLFRFCATVLLVGLGVAGRIAHSAEFIPLGDIPGSDFYSNAFAVTPDGTTVVGQTHSSSGVEAFRWTSDTGMVGLGDLAGHDFVSAARGVSHNGHIVVGDGSAQMSALSNAFRWTMETGMTALDPLAQSGGSFPVTHANGISADGNIVVGEVLEGDETVTSHEAVIWYASGAMQRLGYLHTGASHTSEALAVSADGAVVVGNSSYLPVGGAYWVEEAFRWTQDSGMVGLGNLTNDPKRLSTAGGVSEDGTVIVGVSETDDSPFLQPFMWIAASGMTALGGSGPTSFPMAVSDQGQNVVGYTPVLDAPGNVYVAWVWDRFHGIRPLQHVLNVEFGLQLDGWQLEFARDITSDGRTIIATGINPDGNREAWLVRLDRPIGIPEPITHSTALLGLCCIAIMRRARGRK